MELVLSSEQIKVVSGILISWGHISLISVVVPCVLPEFRLERFDLIISGLGFAILFWLLGIIVVEGAKK